MNDQLVFVGLCGEIFYFEFIWEPNLGLGSRMRLTIVLHQSCRGVARSSRAKEAETRAMLDRMIRVDHAGEFGADRIYAGQHAVLKNTEVGDLIQHMWDQEKHHLSTFNKLIPATRSRPTALLPIWQVS